MIKQLSNSVIAKYFDLSVSRISRCFAQPRLIIVNHCFTYQALKIEVGTHGFLLYLFTVFYLIQTIKTLLEYIFFNSQATRFGIAKKILCEVPKMGANPGSFKQYSVLFL